PSNSSDSLTSLGAIGLSSIREFVHALTRHPLSIQRRGDVEVGLACDADESSLQHNECPKQRQTWTGALVTPRNARLQPLEFLDEPPHVLGFDADAGSAHAYL